MGALPSTNMPSTVGVGSSALRIILVVARRSCIVRSFLASTSALNASGNIEKLEPPQIQVVQRGGGDWMGVERCLAVASFLVENAFVLHAGDGAAWADAGPNAPSIAHRGRVGRRHRDHRHVAAVECVFVDGHGRQGQDVAVRLAVRELKQQRVVYLKAGGCAVVVRADEDHAGATVVRQVVGERANGLSHGVRRLAVECLLALDEIGFAIREHGR